MNKYLILSIASCTTYILGLYLLFFMNIFTIGAPLAFLGISLKIKEEMDKGEKSN